MKTITLNDEQEKWLSICLNVWLRDNMGDEERKALNDVFKQLAGRDHA